MLPTANQSLASVLAIADQHAARRLPGAKRRAPLAQRNLSIFKMVEVEKATHQEAAAAFRLKRPRITQIVNQVRCQLAEAAPDDPDINDLQARLRLDKKLEKMQLEFARDHVAKAIRRESRSLVTNRAGSRHKNGQVESWSECANRDKPTNVQLVKTFVKIVGDIGQLRQRETLTDPPPKTTLSDEQLFAAVAEVLESWHYRQQDAENSASEEFYEMVSVFCSNIRGWVHARRHGVPRHQAWTLNDDRGPVAWKEFFIRQSYNQRQPDEPVESSAGACDANHPHEEINIGLTSSGADFANTTPAPQTA
jgi:hypothetical protein